MVESVKYHVQNLLNYSKGRNESKTGEADNRTRHLQLKFSNTQPPYQRNLHGLGAH